MMQATTALRQIRQLQMRRAAWCASWGSHTRTVSLIDAHRSCSMIHKSGCRADQCAFAAPAGFRIASRLPSTRSTRGIHRFAPS